MKNLPLVVLVTPTSLSPDKLADHKRHSRGIRIITLLFLSLLLSSIDTVRAASAKPNDPYQEAQSCGVFALARLGELLHIAPEAREQIMNTPSPEGGFSVADLQMLAAKYHMTLAGVRWTAETEIVVPSIVHLKIGHYGLIVERKGSKYRLLDGESGVWVDLQTLRRHTSGAFLVPEQSLSSVWERLTTSEASAHRGGLICVPCSTLPDDEDPPVDCCDDNDDQDADCDPPTANDGASDGGDELPPPPCCCDMGLARWHLSQPYINLWLIDRPLLYKTSNNKWFPLKLTYKSRGIDHGTNSFGFGPKWECNWIGLMQAIGTRVTNYHTGGGSVGMAASYSSSIYRSGQILDSVTGGGYRMTGPRGGINHFTTSFVPIAGVTDYYLDQRIDRYGRIVHYNYENVGGVTRLASVTDTDGNTSTISYGSTNLISSVTDPYGHIAHFYYMNGYLTNIVDAAGMSSMFYYDTNGFITNMLTPYGTTAFGYYSDTNGNRAVLVTEANAEHQLFSYVPSLVQSFHWNRSQYNAISDYGKTNYLSMQPEDYDKATLSEWLLYGADGLSTPGVSDTIMGTAPPVDPLLNIRPGFTTFKYQGQSDGDDSHTGTLKRITSITRDGVPQVAIERNFLGRPLIVTNYNGDGSISARTNTFDISGRYLQKQSGSHSEMVRGYGYSSGVTNLLISVTNAVGDVTRYTHDTNTMKVTSITFPTGLIRNNEYTSGFLTKQTDQGFRTNSFTYSNGNLLSQTDELGLVTTRSYDELNRLRQINFPDGTTVSNFYDKLDLVGVKDRLGLWTRYTYDSVRQLRSETNANGAVTTYDYCSCGSPNTITRWDGVTALTDSFAYDILGRLTNATYADGYQLNYLYNGSGLLAAVSDSSGLTLALNYVQLGQKFKISSALLAGQTNIAYTYDDYGRVVGTFDRNGITVTNAYDLLDRLVTRVTLDQYGTPYATNSYVYNARGLTNIIDALNNATLFVRDASGRLQYQTNANNEVLQFTYNPADELLTLADGKNQITRWNYNEYGWVTNKLDQSNTEVLRYTFNPDGRLTNRWSAAKGNTKYKYDSVGNLTNIDYPVSTDISFAYDSLNRLTNMIDAVGTTIFTYSPSGQLQAEDGPFGSDMVTNIYWSRLRTNLTLIQPTGVWTNAFAYSSANRLNGVASPAGTFTYTYDEPSTRMTYLNLPSGAYVYNQYDTLSRLTNSFLWGSGVALDGHVYEYDRENQRTSEIRADSSTVAYSYDNIGQLKIADSSVPAEDRGYTYDTAWNLNYRTNNLTLSTFAVDNKNQLTNSFAARNVYDSNGNMVTNNNNHNVLVYDDENQLTRYYHYQNSPGNVIAGDTLSQFIYDGLGRLRKRIEWVVSCNAGESPQGGPGAGAVPNGGGGGATCTWGEVSETWYVYDGWRVIQERDSNNVPTVSYTRGNDLSVSLEGAGGIGGLLARSSGYSSGNWTSHADYYADAGGNVSSLIDGNQTVVASYRYDPFGNIISKSGTLATANVYRFSSKEAHINSGMCYYGYRFYDPNLQRWINRDPINERGGVNLYCFAKNGPVGFVDPRGLNWFTEAGHQINCATGNMLGKLGTLFGGDAAETDESGRRHFEYSPVVLPGTAITLGNVSIYSGPRDAPVVQEGTVYPVSEHEGAHVGQSQDLGIFYLPGYVYAALATAVMGGDWWKDNPMEQGPNCSPPVPWP